MLNILKFFYMRYEFHTGTANSRWGLTNTVILPILATQRGRTESNRIQPYPWIPYLTVSKDTVGYGTVTVWLRWITIIYKKSAQGSTKVASTSTMRPSVVSKEVQRMHPSQHHGQNCHNRTPTQRAWQYARKHQMGKRPLRTNCNNCNLINSSSK